MYGQLGHNTRPHARLPPRFHGHGCMHDLTIERRSLRSQATWVIDVLGLFFDMLPVGVCTARHWQTSDRMKLSVL